jgi:hypothetical protein
MRGFRPRNWSGRVRDSRQDRACYSSSADPALRLLRRSVLRIERRSGERVFISAPIKPVLTVGVAF